MAYRARGRRSAAIAARDRRQGMERELTEAELDEAERGLAMEASIEAEYEAADSSEQAS